MDINKISREMSVEATTQSRAVDKKVIKETFKLKMENIHQDHIRTELTSIYSQIEEVSQKLQDKLMLSDLIEYKQLVKKFMQIAVKNSHVFFKENSLDRRGRHRIYSIVKQVDHELAELTEDFVDSESNKLDILSRIDQIKGMLMDILT